MNKRQNIISELDLISAASNFLMVLIRLVSINLNSSLENLATRDYRELLNQNEIAFLFGLWLKNRHQKTKEIVEISQMCDKVHQLMNDLHFAIYESVPKLSQNTTYEELMINSAQLQETIFYSGTGAYDYQFMDYLRHKYKYDLEWIKKNKDVDLSDFIVFYSSLRSILKIKLNYKDIPKDSIEIYSIDKNCYIFKKNPEFLKIINLFSIKDDEVLNSDLNDIGDLNEFALRPIIDTANKYIFPFPYLIAETMFQSPFYWMKGDNTYKDIAAKNRGTVAEEIVKTELLKIFPCEHVYNNVFVNINKTTRLTDIDVCIFFEGILVMFQVKSKMLTQLSKKGDLSQIKMDFTKAVEESFKQAIKVYDRILYGTCKLVDEKRKELINVQSIKEIYSICIVLDNYPPLLVHSRVFYHDKESVPIAMSIFDFQVLVKYLTTPLKFIDYIKKRTTHSKTIVTDTELSYLKFFLDYEFKIPENSDLLMLDGDFGQYFDKHFYMQLLDKYESQFPNFVNDIGRNDGCFCGSGKKFKHCCKNQLVKTGS